MNKGTQLSEYTYNEERVILRISPTKVGQEKKEDRPSHHVPGDVREEAKRECIRQHMNRWIQGSSGRFAKAIPQTHSSSSKSSVRNKTLSFLTSTLKH